ADLKIRARHALFSFIFCSEFYQGRAAQFSNVRLYRSVSFDGNLNVRQEIILDIGNRNLIAEDDVKIDPLVADNIIQPKFDIGQKKVDVLELPRVLEL